MELVANYELPSFTFPPAAAQPEAGAESHNSMRSMRAVPFNDAPQPVVVAPSEPAQASMPASTSGSFNRTHQTTSQPQRTMTESDAQASRNFDLYKLHSAHLDMVDGDTLVFVDFPAPSHNWRQKVDCHGIAYHSQAFRVHAERLLATESSKFAEMLNSPTYQYRIQRRRKVVNKLPEGVKYVLDLTPPSEGDDLVFQVTELSLPPGIIKWWTAAHLHGVESYLVSGHDDLCSCGMHASSRFDVLAEGLTKAFDVEVDPEETTPPKPERLLRMKARCENDIFRTPEVRDIPDYSPVRHCNAIVRLLMLIEGQDVPFDSANRVWTMVAISKILDCTSVVRDKVAQWLMHRNNTRIIEVLPEEALHIGTALQLPEVTQCAFRILVNELALEEAATDPQRKVSSQTTLFGRKRGNLGDELSNLVQHAATALVERATQTIQQFHNPDLFDYFNIEEWNKLRRIEQLLTEEGSELTQRALTKLCYLKRALTQKISDQFDEHTHHDTIIRNTEALQSMDRDLATYVEPRHYECLSVITHWLNSTQTLLLPFVYSDLGNLWEKAIFPGRSSTHPESFGRSFVDLHNELETEVQGLLNCNPALARTEAWAPFVEPLPQRFGAAATACYLRQPLIDVCKLDRQVAQALRPVTNSWIRHDFGLPLNITRHLLLTLTPDETKFLPLWAGGCDDGTGGVFEPFVPPADMGPSGPGPAFHTGLTLPSGPPSLAGSLADDMREMRLRGSSAAASGSVDVHDSVSTVYRPDRVVADDGSVASEAFTTGGSEYQDAQFEVPAEHQSRGQAVDMLVETVTDSESQATTTDYDSVMEGVSEAPTASNDDARSEGSMVFL